MKRIFGIAIATIVISFYYLQPVAAETLEQYYFPTDGALSKREKIALDEIKKWREGKTDGSKPITNPQGDIQYIYGAGLPVISVAVMQVTDIEMEPGERITNMNIGDKRFTLEPAVSGMGDSETQHIIVRPLDSGLTTSLVVATERRTYHITLKSYKNDFMPKVSFIYEENVMEKWLESQNYRKLDIKKHTIPGTGDNIQNMDFDYSISGNGKWKPVRVYNNGRQTIIEMPKKMTNGEAPSLMVLRDTGEEVLANYSLKDAKYTVDTIFDAAVLRAGVGSKQEKILIERNGASKENSTVGSLDKKPKEEVK